jgi:hypothetical protein
MRAAYAGDRVRLRDGREVKATGWRLAIQVGVGSSESLRISPYGEPDVYVPMSEVVEVLEHAPHEYEVGKRRGHCGRCDTRKRDHGVPNRARGFEGTWLTPPVVQS